MNKTEFTPGSWKYDGCNYVNTEKDYRMVAQVRGWGWLQKKGDAEAVKEQDANGYLLASAPDMYACLLSVRSKLEAYPELCKKVDAVLGKARGEGTHE